MKLRAPTPARRRSRFALALLALLPLIALAAEPSSTPPSSPATNSVVVIPFEMRGGHVMLPARVNGSPALPFMLDTGYGMTMLRPGHAEELSLRRTGHVTIVGIAGEKEAGVFDGPSFDFGGLVWKPRRVGAFPAGENSRQRHGILGSGFFKRFVVEIDARASHVILREPASFTYQDTGEILPLKFKDTTPIVEATILRADQSTVTAQFEIDTGCDSCLCVGRDFADRQGLFPTNAPSSGARSGIGGGTSTRAGRMPRLQLGELSLTNVRANFFLSSSPADPPLAGHIGWELLRDHRVILDYSRKRMILETMPER